MSHSSRSTSHSYRKPSYPFPLKDTVRLPYNPTAAGSATGAVDETHDKALLRASRAEYEAPTSISSNENLTLFFARLHPRTDESRMKEVFSAYGQVKSVCIVRDKVTGESRRYGFVEYGEEPSLLAAWRHVDGMLIDGAVVLIDYERARTTSGWVPRRLGGGLGGRKESGQLRFGCRDRPFLPSGTKGRRISRKHRKQAEPPKSRDAEDISIGVIAHIEKDAKNSNSTSRTLYYPATSSGTEFIDIS